MENRDADQVGRIFQALAAVKDEINAIGVSKGRTNKQQGYQYRGIDDVMDAFSGPFARNRVLPSFVYDVHTESQIETNAGKFLLRTVVKGVFTFVSLEDGSTFTVGPIYGEASDTLDKSFTKATSVCFRNAMFLMFTVPFGPEADPEAGDNGDIDPGETGVEPVAASRDKDAGPGVLDVSKSQEKVLSAKLSVAGRDMEWLLSSFGSVSSQNINKALDFIRAQGQK